MWQQQLVRLIAVPAFVFAAGVCTEVDEPTYGRGPGTEGGYVEQEREGGVFGEGTEEGLEREGLEREDGLEADD